MYYNPYPQYPQPQQIVTQVKIPSGHFHVKRPLDSTKKIINELVNDLGLEYQEIYSHKRYGGVNVGRYPGDDYIKDYNLTIYVWSNDKDKLEFFKYLYNNIKQKQKELEVIISGKEETVSST